MIFQLIFQCRLRTESTRFQDGEVEGRREQLRQLSGQGCQALGQGTAWGSTRWEEKDPKQDPVTAAVSIADVGSLPQDCSVSNIPLWKGTRWVWVGFSSQMQQVHKFIGS